MLPSIQVVTELADITFVSGPREDIGVAWKQQSSHLQDLQVVQELEGSEDGDGKHRNHSYENNDSDGGRRHGGER